MNNSFDLRSYRENILKMTQGELAQLLEMRQDQISRLEHNPDQISLAFCIKLAAQTGTSLDQLISYQKPIPKAMKVKDKWEKVRYLEATLTDYINNFSDNYKKANRESYAPSINELQQCVTMIIRKPRVVFVGRSDSGKSTIINTLIGQNKMPTNWTPTTSITVYIKHINDRPSYLEEEVWIFKKGQDSEDWDDTRLADEHYCREWKIAGGNAEMLSSYGVRHGENYRNDIGSAVVFIDSDILKNCDLLDIPGFTGGLLSDNIAARKAKLKADILVFLSPANSFMGSEDFSYLKDALGVLGIIENDKNLDVAPFANLFVVATQAHIIDHGNPQKLREILDDGCARFADTLTEKFWEDRTKISGIMYSEPFLRARFFTYTTDIESVRNKFEENLKTIIEALPELVIVKSIYTEINNICDDAKIKIDKDIKKYQQMIDEREKYDLLLSEIEKKEPERLRSVREQKQNILKHISACETNSRKLFKDEYDELLSDNSIIRMIDNKNYKSKKEDMQRLSSYLSSKIEDSLKSTLEIESKVLSKEIESFISSFESGCYSGGVNISGINMTDFNAKRAFASGLAGLATYGGLAFWASTLGNLGGYILVAKGVSLLSALGISIAGGTATATAFIASIGGPVVLGIALAVVTALGAFGIFTGNWKKKIAKKIRQSYQEQEGLMKYYECIETFWDDTENAFNHAANNMEEEWMNYVNNLREIMHNYDINYLESCIKEGRSVYDFFTNIPL